MGPIRVAKMQRVKNGDVILFNVGTDIMVNKAKIVELKKNKIEVQFFHNQNTKTYDTVDIDIICKLSTHVNDSNEIDHKQQSEEEEYKHAHVIMGRFSKYHPCNENVEQFVSFALDEIKQICQDIRYDYNSLGIDRQKMIDSNLTSMKWCNMSRLEFIEQFLITNHTQIVERKKDDLGKFRDYMVFTEQVPQELDKKNVSGMLVCACCSWKNEFRGYNKNGDWFNWFELPDKYITNQISAYHVLSYCYYTLKNKMLLPLNGYNALIKNTIWLNLSAFEFESVILTRIENMFGLQIKSAGNIATPFLFDSNTRISARQFLQEYRDKTLSKKFGFLSSDDFSFDECKFRKVKNEIIENSSWNVNKIEEKLKGKVGRMELKYKSDDTLYFPQHGIKVSPNEKHLEDNVTKSVLFESFCDNLFTIIADEIDAELNLIGHNNSVPSNVEQKNIDIKQESENELFSKSRLMSLECSGIWKECGCIQRIIQLLNVYNNEYELEAHIKMFGEDYDNRAITNDFQHFLRCHKNAFEDIYNKIKPCNIGGCVIIMRNFRDRSRPKLTPILFIQNIDKIHSYFMHSFDTNMTIKKDDLKVIQQHNEEKEEGIDEDDSVVFDNLCNFIRDRKQKMPQIKDLKERLHDISNKFTADTNSASKIKQDTKSSDKKVGIYSFGVEFTYANPSWNGLYPKYDSLKQELLRNTVSKLNVETYANLIVKAIELLLSNYARTIYHQDKRNNGYIHTLDLEHMVAILLYCNMDKFQGKWTKTFRDNSKKTQAKHAELWHISFALKKCVNTFGDNAQRKKIPVYHGINTELLFTTPRAWFSCPTSTSYDITVAINFSNSIGLILELNESFNSKYFLCEAFSDYPNEKEYLILGTEFRIANIMHARYNHNYAMFLKALNLFERIVDESNNDQNNSKKIQKILAKMLQHQLLVLNTDKKEKYEKYKKFEQMPDYIGRLLSTFLDSKKMVKVNVRVLLRENQHQLLKSIFASQSNPYYISLDWIHTLFKNITELTWSAYWIEDFILFDALDFIFEEFYRYRFRYLEKVTLRVDEKWENEMTSEVIQKYNTKFKCLSFKVTAHNDGSGVFTIIFQK